MKNIGIFIFILLPVLITASNKDSIVFTNLSTGQILTLHIGEKVGIAYTNKKGDYSSVKGYFRALTEDRIVVNQSKNFKKLNATSVLKESIINIKLYKKLEGKKNFWRQAILIFLSIVIIFVVWFFLLLLAYAGLSNFKFISGMILTPILVVTIAYGITKLFYSDKIDLKKEKWEIEYFKSEVEDTSVFAP